VSVQLYEFHLRRDPADAGRARDYVAGQCSGLLPDVAMTAQLLASELFSCALSHGTGPITLTVARSEATLEVCLGDALGVAASLEELDASDPDHRGLLSVAALATTWGVRPVPGGGTTVWFTLDARR
jgi:hypothetical protein